jgi:integrase/recombinase XerD
MNNDFDTYRQQNGYSATSIEIQNYHIKHFLTWCGKHGITPESVTYNHVLQFIDTERERGLLNQSIVTKINAVKVYFDYLVERKKIRQNVVKRIKIKQNKQKTLTETLSAQQLESIYQNFVNLPQWEHRTQTAKELHKRNIVLLGLLVYQGLTSGETAKLEAGHINLMEGKIYIPSTRKSNARTLKLQASQILPVKNYLDEYNPQPFLFPTKKQSDLICKIIQQAKRINPEIRDSRQIRASVIMNWLKTNHLRQVQYMAGHRSIRSTEEYKNQDLSDLAKQLELFHPLQ